MSEDYSVEYVNLARDRNVAEVQNFLQKFGLTFSNDVDFTIILRDQNGNITGTGSSQGEILRNIAVDPTIQGEGLTARILSVLMQNMAQNGIFHYFIFTKPDTAFLFANLGFQEIARAEPYAALLESGHGSVMSYCQKIAAETDFLPKERATLVINANPFTKGHRALVEKAASEAPAVIIFVVSEERSLFPFRDRLRLVREGVQDLENVAVVEGGKYIISSATFPTYFTREQDHVAAQTRLDLSLFAQQIASRLFITSRYIGEEPYCPVTAQYNSAMNEILPKAGIRVHIIPRVTSAGEVISASKVRDLIRINDWETLEKLVPETTLNYLQDKQNQPVLDKIRSTYLRH